MCFVSSFRLFCFVHAFVFVLFGFFVNAFVLSAFEIPPDTPVSGNADVLLLLASELHNGKPKRGWTDFSFRDREIPANALKCRFVYVNAGDDFGPDIFSFANRNFFSGAELTPAASGFEPDSVMSKLVVQSASAADAHTVTHTRTVTAAEFEELPKLAFSAKEYEMIRNGALQSFVWAGGSAASQSPSASESAGTAASTAAGGFSFGDAAASFGAFGATPTTTATTTSTVTTTTDSIASSASTSTSTFSFGDAARAFDPTAWHFGSAVPISPADASAGFRSPQPSTAKQWSE